MSILIDVGKVVGIIVALIAVNYKRGWRNGNTE